MVRGKIENGEDYVLITNLVDTTKYTFQELGDLSRLIWPNKESFKHLKLRGELENLSRKTTLSVKQDVFRIIARANLSQVISITTTTKQKVSIANGNVTTKLIVNKRTVNQKR